MTKVCGSKVWLVVGSRCSGSAGGGPAGSLGNGVIFVSRLKRTVRALAARAGGVGMGFAGAVGVVVGIEGYEMEELFGVGGNVGADEVFVFSEGYGYGGECEVVLLLVEAGVAVVGAVVELIADVGGLSFGEGELANIDALVTGIRLAVDAAA